MANLEDIVRGAQASYDREYRTKGLQIVTSGVNKTSGGDGGQDESPQRMTVMKYYTVKPKEYFTNRHYDEHHGQTYRIYTKTIQPRKLYTATEVYDYARYINKVAGRTLETDEMNLLLKTIARGRHYELVCVVDITEELDGQTVWVDRK